MTDVNDVNLTSSLCNSERGQSIVDTINSDCYKTEGTRQQRRRGPWWTTLRAYKNSQVGIFRTSGDWYLWTQNVLRMLLRPGLHPEPRWGPHSDPKPPTLISGRFKAQKGGEREGRGMGRRGRESRGTGRMGRDGEEEREGRKGERLRSGPRGIDASAPQKLGQHVLNWRKTKLKNYAIRDGISLPATLNRTSYMFWILWTMILTYDLDMRIRPRFCLIYVNYQAESWL